MTRSDSVVAFFFIRVELPFCSDFFSSLLGTPFVGHSAPDIRLSDVETVLFSLVALLGQYEREEMSFDIRIVVRIE